MPYEKYTRCPNCATLFRVTAEQISARGGQVRCGRCKAVFDGEKEQVAQRLPEPSVGSVALAGGTTSALATDIAADVAPATAALEAPSTAMIDGARQTSDEAPHPQGVDDAPEAAREDRYSPVTRRGSRRRQGVVYGGATAFLVLLIAGQAIFHYRDWIAANWPSIRPTLVRLCDAAGCAIRPLRDASMSNLSIEASDLQADPAHRGLLILTATLRNRAPWAVSYPYLELTLTDAQDRVVVRRALAPADYAPGTADVAGGIASNGEVAIKVFIDASATAQAGYRLYMFYP